MNLFLILPLVGFVTSILGYIIFKRYIRPYYPIRVSCWFCGCSSSVPYPFRNNWDCQSCDQYNGFKEDGDYNKILHAQYDESYNKASQGDGDASDYLPGRDLLCQQCLQNQLLKVQQLAKFVPYKEKNFDAEVEAFKDHLEKVYRLCLTCEMKVKQELDEQDESIFKGLRNRDQWQRLQQLNQEEEVIPILHSSYSDRRKNRLITASIILHAVTFVCSIGLLLGQIDLASLPVPWLDSVCGTLHPYFVTLDKNSNVLLAPGLCSGILAKLFLGKYRLFIVDAISCPVWLLVLLLQTGFLQLQESGSLLLSLHAFNTIVSTVCLSLTRRRRNQPKNNISRMSLDNTDSCSSVSSISPYSSISQVPENNPDDNPALTTTQTQFHAHERSRSQLHPSHHRSEVKTTNTDENGVTSTSGNNFNRDCRDDDDSGSVLEDTTSDLLACSLGGPTLPQTSSGYTLTNFLSNLNNTSVTESLRNSNSNKSRPLISPGKFTFSRADDRHASCSTPDVGLFSNLSPSTPSPSPFQTAPLGGSSNLWHPSPQRPSAFNPLHDLSSRPPSVQRNTPSFFEMRGSSSHAGHKQRPSSSLRMFKPVKERASVISSRKDLRSYDDLSDSEDECNTCASSIRSRQPDSTTTPQRSEQHTEVPFWRHPALIGFVLGGSIVANVMLAVQRLWGDTGRT